MVVDHVLQDSAAWGSSVWFGGQPAEGGGELPDGNHRVLSQHSRAALSLPLPVVWAPAGHTLT